jgi:hypothetical protein
MARSKAPRKRKPAPTSRRSQSEYPKRFLDTHFDPLLVCIEPPDLPDSDVALQSMPADTFILATEAGILPIFFDPWDKHTGYWADEFDDGSPPVR